MEREALYGNWDGKCLPFPNLSTSPYPFPTFHLLAMPAYVLYCFVSYAVNASLPTVKQKDGLLGYWEGEARSPFPKLSSLHF